MNIGEQQSSLQLLQANMDGTQGKSYKCAILQLTTSPVTKEE